MVSFYLASRFGRRQELTGYSYTLQNNGFVVTSRWLTQHQALDLHADKKVQYTNNERTQFALHDYEDVYRASRLIAFTEDPLADIGVVGRRGGRHVELGLAIAWGKLVYVVGYRENVFCHLPQVMFYPTFNDLLETL